MKRNNKSKIVIVMPAYNAARTLRKTIRDIPARLRRHIILVDDSSTDKTVKVAKELKLKIVIHERNKGYGANQKTCYSEALKLKADIIVMLHPDYQYDPKQIPALVKPVLAREKDIMLGSRITTFAASRKGKMPSYKFLANRFLTIIENIFLNQRLSEYHTGLRAYSKSILKNTPYKLFSDNFVFDQQMLIYTIKKGARVGEIPVATRYFPEASSISFLNSVQYGLGTLWNLFFLKPK